VRSTVSQEAGLSTSTRGIPPTPDPERHHVDVGLLLRQLSAIESWTSAQRESAPAPASVTREMRLDLSRRMAARRREQQALIQRAHDHLRASGSLLGHGGRPRALLAHRNDWLRTKLRDHLVAHGIEVVGEFTDGADAAGTLVAEQPELVLVEDRLPTVTGVEVIRRARQYCPDSVVGVQVLDGSGIDEALAAGALAVFSRRITPGRIADELVGCLLQRRVVTLR